MPKKSKLKVPKARFVVIDDSQEYLDLASELNQSSQIWTFKWFINPEKWSKYVRNNLEKWAKKWVPVLLLTDQDMWKVKWTDVAEEILKTNKDIWAALVIWCWSFTMPDTLRALDDQGCAMWLDFVISKFPEDTILPVLKHYKKKAIWFLNSGAIKNQKS